MRQEFGEGSIGFVAELQNTLDKVKRVNVLLPICASCKRTRDDSGQWHQFEAHKHDLMQVEFSHGICPDCADKIYGELSAYKKKDFELDTGG